MATSSGADEPADRADVTGPEDGDADQDVTFADLLNGFTLGGRPGRRPAPEPAPPEPAEPVARPYDQAPRPGDREAGSRYDPYDPYDRGAAPLGRAGSSYDRVGYYRGSSDYDRGEPEYGRRDPVDPAPSVDRPAHDLPPLPAVDDLDVAAIVRPYTWTRGRTRSNVDLKLETLVSSSVLGHKEALLGRSEYQAVSALCRHPHSVAEVAAKLSIPLGVARVILSDMAELGLIIPHQTVADDDFAAHLALMERVLSGLRRL